MYPESASSTPSASKKPLTIALVAFGAVVVLVLIYFLGAQFVGKAISLPPTVFPTAGTGGIQEVIGLPIASNNPVTLHIGARLPSGKESVAYQLRLTFDPAVVSHSRTDSQLLSDWGNDFLRTSVDNSGSTPAVIVEHATIDFTQAISGGVLLADVTFNVLPSQQLTAANVASVFQLTTLQVIDLDDPAGMSNLVTSIVPISGGAPEVALDGDSDSIPDARDNCPAIANPDQANHDNDGVGDACDLTPCGANAHLGGVSGTAECICDAGYLNNDGIWDNGCEAVAPRADCPAAAACPTPANVNLDYDADGNGIVNNDDVFIIKLAFRARDANLEPQASCGAAGQSYCLFTAQGYYICENLQWRFLSAGAPSPNRCGAMNVLGSR